MAYLVWICMNPSSKFITSVQSSLWGSTEEVVKKIISNTGPVQYIAMAYLIYCRETRPDTIAVTLNSNKENYRKDVIFKTLSIEWLSSVPYEYNFRASDFNITDDATSIPTNAFNEAPDFNVTNLPYNIKTIGSFAFEFCKKLTISELPSGIEIIGSAAFTNTAVQFTELPDKIKEIDVCTFSDCEQLRTIKIPRNVELIRRRAFESCTNLTKVTLPDDIQRIGEKTFAECKNLQEINIPINMKIGKQAFLNCNKLRLDLRSHKKTDFESDAFEGCDNVILPASD